MCVRQGWGYPEPQTLNLQPCISNPAQKLFATLHITSQNPMHTLPQQMVPYQIIDGPGGDTWVEAGLNPA